MKSFFPFHRQAEKKKPGPAARTRLVPGDYAMAGLGYLPSEAIDLAISSSGKG